VVGDTARFIGRKGATKLHLDSGPAGWLPGDRDKLPNSACQKFSKWIPLGVGCTAAGCVGRASRGSSGRDRHVGKERRHDHQLLERFLRRISEMGVSTRLLSAIRERCVQ
jgi:hypothetical protein